jgi:hypothetical protein
MFTCQVHITMASFTVLSLMCCALPFSSQLNYVLPVQLGCLAEVSNLGDLPDVKINIEGIFSTTHLSTINKLIFSWAGNGVSDSRLTLKVSLNRKLK